MYIWDKLTKIKIRDNVCDLCHKYPVFRIIEPIVGKTNRTWRLCAGCLRVNQHLLFNKHTAPLINIVNIIRKVLSPNWSDEIVLNDNGKIEPNKNIVVNRSAKHKTFKPENFTI